jgi:hypothetical protein
MAEPGRDKILETVNKMFELIKRTDGVDGLDADGVPSRLRNMAKQVYSPDIRFHVPGKGPQAFEGGLEDYYEYNIVRVQKTAGSQRLELQDVIASDRRAAALIRYTDERDGETFSWLRANVYTFNETGDQITEIHVYEHDQYGVDAWFSQSLAE